MPTLQVDWVEPEDIGRRWMELDGRAFLEQNAKGRLIVHATSSLAIAPAPALVKERS